MKRLIVMLFAAALLLAPRAVAAQSFEFQVEQQRLFRNHRGTLIITAENVEYKTTYKDEARSWRYLDIQEIKIKSPTEIEIVTYEDQKRYLGRDRIFRFKLLEGQITREVSALLVASATRPVATSIMPATEGAPTFQVPVKHLHTLGGDQGTLNIYPDRVTYESATERSQSRYWRYSDIQSFGHPTRYRFEITTFEREAGGPTRVFNFELKEDLPAQAYDYIWVRTYPLNPYPYERPALANAIPAEKRQTAAAPQKEPETRSGENLESESQAQSVEVALTERGYSPESITLQQGVPARLIFKRQVEATCGNEILIPEYKIKRALPLNESVVIEFTPTKTGEFLFTCGMNMLRGKIVVQERKDSPAAQTQELPQQETRDHQHEAEVQTAKVLLTAGGYKPSSITLRTGIAARVTFVRLARATCGTEIAIPEYRIKRKLPLNQPVVVQFTPDKSGEFTFTCGMGMLRGKIVVREN